MLRWHMDYSELKVIKASLTQEELLFWGLFVFAAPASLVAQRLKRLPGMQETQVQPLSWEDPLEKEMAAHSSTLAWRIPWGRSLVGYSPWGRKESDTTKRLHSLTQSLICSVSRIVLYALGWVPKCDSWNCRNLLNTNS